MTVLTEGNLRITIPNTMQARKFDDGVRHGLSHCMKAVDFIVELVDRYLFIEMKDPMHPLSKSQDRARFIQGFMSGEIDEDLKYKYRDSFLYEWAAGRVQKPVYYLVLIALDTLTEADLTARTDALKHKLPVQGPIAGQWVRSFVAGCAVFNLAAWNKHFPDYPIARLTQ